MTTAFYITGVSRGLGRALFDQLIEAGRHPYGIGRTFTREQRHAAQEDRCVMVRHDLAHPENLSAFDIPHDAERAIFISNAGTIEPGTVGHRPIPDLAASIAVNLTSPMRIAGFLAASCRAQGIPLTVLNISSGAASRPIPGWSAYCAAKAGAAMFFACLAAENKDWDILSIDPGVMDTDMQAMIRSATPDLFPAVDDFIALREQGKLKSPDDVARDILRPFLTA